MSTRGGFTCPAAGARDPQTRLIDGENGGGDPSRVERVGLPQAAVSAGAHPGRFCGLAAGVGDERRAALYDPSQHRVTPGQAPPDYGRSL